MEQNEITERALSVPEQARGIEIRTAEDYSRAGELLLVIKDLRKEINSFFDPIIKKQYDAHKEAVAQKKRADAPLVDAENIIKPRIAAYNAEQERIRREEENRLREIARKEEEERQLQAALEAEAAGEHGDAQQIIDEPVQAPVVVVPKSVPKANGISMRDNWDFEIINENLIPRQYLTPNLNAIRAVVRGLKSQANIPGIKVFKTSIVLAGRAHHVMPKRKEINIGTKFRLTSGPRVGTGQGGQNK